MIETELATYLMSTAAISAIAGDRVYPNTSPRDPAYPCIIYQRVSTLRVRGLDGSAGLVHARFQITYWAKGNGSYIRAKQLAEAVRGKLDNFRGTFVQDGHRVDAVQLLDDADMPKDEGLGADADDAPYGIRHDFQIRYLETVDDNSPA